MRQMCHLLSVAQHNDTVGIIGQLFQLRGDNQQRHTALTQFFNQTNDFRMGTNINAARRFIKNEKTRFCRQPAREQHLLLIAAR